MDTTKSASNKYVYQISVIGVLFFVFGFVTWLNGFLIPFLKMTCELKTDAQSFLVTFAFFMAYFFLAIPSSWILKQTGYKNGMALGLSIMAVGTILFIPAANARSFSLFLTGLFIQGMGLALLQTASNPYVSIIGPIETAAKRISIMGICNKVAGMLGIIIMGVIAFSDADSLEKQLKTITDPLQRDAFLDVVAGRIVTPYIVMTVALILLALMIWRSSLPEIIEEEDLVDTAPARPSILNYPHVLLGALCIFMYVGAEVMAGDLISYYGKKLGFSLATTRFFPFYTIGAMLIGYIVGIIAIPKYLSQQKSLWLASVLGIVLSLAAYFTEGVPSVICIFLLGIANAPMWPAIFPLGIKGLGSWTKLGSALLIMGIAGGAIIPQIYGRFTDAHIWDFKIGFLITMSVCYAYILWFGLKGHKMGMEV